MSIRVNLRIDERWLALGYDLLQEQGQVPRTNAQVARILIAVGLSSLEPSYQNREPTAQGWLYATGGKLAQGKNPNTPAGRMREFMAHLGNESAQAEQPSSEPRWHMLEDSDFKRKAQTLWQHHLAGTTSLEEDSQSEREDLAQVAEWLLGELRSQSSEAAPE